MGRARELCEEKNGLTGRLVHGDQESWKGFFDAYAKRIYNFAYFRLNRHDDAENVVSETFMAAARTIKNLAGEGRSLEAWIHTIARSKVMDVFRQRQKARKIAAWGARNTEMFTAIDNVETTLIPPSVLEDETFHQIVGKILTALPCKYQDALKGRYIDGVDSGEIARRIGCRLSAVDHIVLRAKRAFKKKFREFGCRYRVATSA